MSRTITNDASRSSSSSDSIQYDRLVDSICNRLLEMLGDSVVPVPRVWLTTKEAAAYLRLHPVTLAKLRAKGAGPKCCSRDRLVRYRVKDLDSFLLGDACQQEVADAASGGSRSA